MATLTLTCAGYSKRRRPACCTAPLAAITSSFLVAPPCSHRLPHAHRPTHCPVSSATTGTAGPLPEHALPLLFFLLPRAASGTASCRQEWRVVPQLPLNCKCLNCPSPAAADILSPALRPLRGNDLGNQTEKRITAAAAEDEHDQTEGQLACRRLRTHAPVPQGEVLGSGPGFRPGAGAGAGPG